MTDHSSGYGLDETALRREIVRLQQEVERLSAARLPGAAGDEIDRLRAQVNQLGSQNERLASTLRDAREQIVQLKAEVDRLAQPPNTFGVFVAPAEDGTVEVMSSGRKVDASTLARLHALTACRRNSIHEIRSRASRHRRRLEKSHPGMCGVTMGVPMVT